MSKLFIDDNGRVLKNHNEEITRWRWARKLLHLPKAAANAEADLWILAAPYPETQARLEITVNGRPASAIQPEEARFIWHRVSLPSGRLRAGKNEILLKCDTFAMNSWRLALANGSAKNSFLSLDRGRTWKREQMGVYGVLQGEYVIRLRSRSTRLHDPHTPEIIYSDPKDPRLQELCKMLPKEVARERNAWRKILALRTWVATRWSHRSSGLADCPWDPATILDWTAQGRGHGGPGAVAFCPHFSVVMAGFATALGHKARCVAITPSINGIEGHFVSEIYSPRWEKWVVHDPNFDVHYEDKIPLSAVELSRHANTGTDTTRFMRRGSGFPTTPAHLLTFFRHHLVTGNSYKLFAFWRRMDFLTDPSVAAVHHGSLVYHEPDWLWQTAPHVDIDRELGMFPFRSG